MNIGIVGAENSHTAAIAKVINVEKKVRGACVSHVWGETKAFAVKAAEVGQIATIVRHPEEMIGQVDAVAVDHRHGKFHLPAVRPFLEAKIPLFVDKPFCYRKAEGKRFLARARELGVPVCSFSTLPKQASFKALKQQMRSLGQIFSVVSTGPCDIRSKWGGVFFYGIHQVDMVVRLLGYDFKYAQVWSGQGANHVGQLSYADGRIATLNLVGAGRAAFHISVIGEKGRIDQEIVSDPSSYLTGVKDFVRMFRTSKTDETDASMLGPVAVLEAMEKSLIVKKRVAAAI
jgi:predicted dehydrogenase